jgi:hypothetical protein
MEEKKGKEDMMPIHIEGEEYLSTGESARFLSVSAATFTKFQKVYELRSFSRPGMGQRKFFRRKDLEPLLIFKPTTNSEMRDSSLHNER